jgi:hypothetical protein
MPHLKLSKHMFLEQKIEKQKKLQLIWTYENMSNFNLSKVPNYQMVMVFKFLKNYMNLSSCITSYIES